MIASHRRICAHALSSRPLYPYRSFDLIFLPTDLRLLCNNSANLYLFLLILSWKASLLSIFANPLQVDNNTAQLSSYLDYLNDKQTYFDHDPLKDIYHKTNMEIFQYF